MPEKRTTTDFINVLLFVTNSLEMDLTKFSASNSLFPLYDFEEATDDSSTHSPQD